MIDIGANLADPVFDADRAAVLGRAGAAGLRAIIVTGTSVASSRKAARLALDSDRTALPLFATAGVHPHDAGAARDGWLEAIADLAACERAVAIGETGLDYCRNYSSRADQRRVFRAQVELAVRLDKPLFVHDRESAGETRRILAEFQGAVSCVVHCFTGTAEELEGYLADGHHIGVTGWICDERRGLELTRQVCRIPADRLMIETDAPYLLPRTLRPKPRSRRNEPAFLPWVARRVAACRGEPLAAVAATTRRNAERFFRLPSLPPRADRERHK